MPQFRWADTFLLSWRFFGHRGGLDAQDPIYFVESGVRGRQSLSAPGIGWGRVFCGQGQEETRSELLVQPVGLRVGLGLVWQGVVIPRGRVS